MQRITSALKGAYAYLHSHFWQMSAVIGVLVLAVVLIQGNGTSTVDSSPPPRTVEIVAAADYAQGARGIAVPTANGSAFVIRAEAGGKVTQTRQPGTVSEGTLIAQLENSAQRAALLQAEGAYEVALASSGGNTTSQASARQDGVRTWTSTTVEAAETLRTLIDGYYAEVRGVQGTEGFRLQAFGSAPELNAARNSIETNILDRWEEETVYESNIAARLEALDADLATIGALIDRIAVLIPRQDITTVYAESDRVADAAALATARAAITGLQEDVDTARLAITNASGSGSATADAQIKQALGALEAARANLEKTTVRAPFSGTITSVNVTKGDIVTAGNDIAIITPNEGVSTDRSFALPLSAVKYTPAGAFVFTVNGEGVLETRAIETGLVTADTITITGLSGDEMIVKDVRGLKAGQSVQVAG